MKLPRASVAGLSLAAILIATGWAAPSLPKGHTSGHSGGPSSGRSPQASRLSLVPIASNEILLDLSESADGTRLISNGTRNWDRTFAPKLWDPQTLRILKVLRGHTSAVQFAGFTPDGKRALTHSEDSIRIWNAKTGQLISSVLAGEDKFYSLAVSADSKRLGIGTQKGQVWIADADGSVTAKVQASGSPVFSLAVSPDGNFVVAGGMEGKLRVVDVAAAKMERELEPMSGLINFIEFSPDGKQILANSFVAKKGRLIDFATGKSLLERPHEFGIRSVGTTQAGATFVGKAGELALFANPSGTMELFDRQTLNPAGELKGHTERIRELRVAPDGQSVATYGDDDTLRMWDVEKRAQRPYNPAEEGPTAAGFSADSRSFWIGYLDGSIRRYDVGSGEPKSLRRGSVRPMLGMEPIGDGRYYATHHPTHYQAFAGQVSQTLVWDASRPGQPRRLREGLWTEFSPNGRYAFVGDSRRNGAHFQDVFAPDSREGQKTHFVGGFAGMRWLQGGEQFVTWHEKGWVGVWDSRNMELIQGWEFKGTESPLWDLAVSPDEVYAASTGHAATDDQGNETRHAYIWKLRESGTFIPLGKLSSVFARLAYTPDGKYVALNDGARVWLASAADGSVAREFQEIPKVGDDLVFEGAKPEFVRNGEFMVLRSRTKIAVWRVADGKRIGLWDHDYADAANLANPISPDGRWIALANRNRVNVVEMQSGKPAASAEIDSNVAQVQFSPDGRRLFLSGADDGATVLDVSSLRLESTEVPLNRLGNFLVMTNEEWLAMDAAGRFDAADPNRVDGASFVLEWSGGMEPIEVAQMKSRFYDPGLFAKMLGLDDSPRRTVPSLSSLKLYPRVAILPDARNAERVEVEVEEQDGGGIGKVFVFVNGKQVEEKEGSGYFEVDLSRYRSFLLPESALGSGESNLLSIVAANGGNDLTAPARTYAIPTPKELQVPEARLFALTVGVSDYVGTGGDLMAPARDATEIARALGMAANRLLKDRVEIQTLTTAAKEPDRRPTRQNILKWFAETAAKATSGDIVVAFFAGHGTNKIGDRQDYFFLTPDVDPTDVGPAAIGLATLSAEDLKAALAKIPAAKQVVILDTCHSGAASGSLIGTRSVAGDYARAYESIRDGSGTWLLAGSASDQLSYESSNVDHGMLTYSLLEAIDRAAPGGLRPSESGALFLDVEQWFGYAASRVESLKAEVGVPGVQKPEFRRSSNRSFDLGVVAPEDRGKIGLAPPKPIVIVGAFGTEEQEDPAALEPMISAALRQSAKVKPWFDIARHPNVYRIAGTYTQEGETVRVRLFIQQFDAAQNRKTLETVEVVGGKSDVAAKILATVEARLTSK